MYCNDINTFSIIFANNIINTAINNVVNKQKYSVKSWSNIINNKSYLYKLRKIRIFPSLKNKNDYSKIQIDDESFNYITIKEIANYTSKVICHHVVSDFLNPLKITICDLSAGVGGNTLSFSNYFKCVYAIEILKNRYEYLDNNLKVYKCKNVNTFNMCSIDFINNKMLEINPTVLFIDPPWGGNGYKKIHNLELTLGNYTLEQLIVVILNKFSNLYKNLENETERNKFIILKLPKNYNIINFYKNIKNSCINNYIVKNYLYIFSKMILVVSHCIYINYQID